MSRLLELTQALEKAEQEGNFALIERFREELIVYALECAVKRDGEKKRREERKRIRSLVPKRVLAPVPYGHCNRCPWCGWTLGATDRKCSLKRCGLGQRRQQYKKKKCAGCGARYAYTPKRGKR